MTGRLFGPSHTSTSTTAFEIIASYLHGLKNVEAQIHQISESVLAEPPKRTADALQSASLALSWHLRLIFEAVREELGDSHRAEAALLVEDCVAMLAERLRERSVQVDPPIVRAASSDRVELRASEVRRLAHHLCGNEPRTMKLVVSASDESLVLSAEAGRSLHGFRGLDRDGFRDEFNLRTTYVGGRERIEAEFPRLG